MNLEEYTHHDAVGLADLVRRGEVHPSELATLATRAIKAVNGTINGVIEVYDNAEDQPDASENEPFGGVPFLRKDIGATEQGRLTEMGSRLCEGMVAARDAGFTQRCRAAGLRFLGRTTTPEFGLHGTTETIACGATANPWDPTRIAGGSSGGAAAMVAAGVVPMAHASDGGGSIRIPAACNGLIGLKPSRGRIVSGPGGLGYPKISTELVVSRTVRDTAVALDALAGRQPGEPFDIPAPMMPWSQTITMAPRRLRVGVTTTTPDGSRVHSDVAANIEATAAALEELGHEVVDAAPDLGFERLKDAFSDLFAIMGTGAIGILAERLGRPVDESTLEPVTLRWYEHACSLDALAYEQALTVCDRVARRMGAFHETVDVALSPLLTQPPPLLGTQGGTQHHLSQAESAALLFELCLTPILNMSGQPGISVPTGQTASGLPLGVQFAGRFGDEATLLQVAAQLEQAMPWRDRRPVIHAANPGLE